MDVEVPAEDFNFTLGETHNEIAVADAEPDESQENVLTIPVYIHQDDQVMEHGLWLNHSDVLAGMEDMCYFIRTDASYEPKEPHEVLTGEAWCEVAGCNKPGDWTQLVRFGMDYANCATSEPLANVLSSSQAAQEDMKTNNEGHPENVKIEGALALTNGVEHVNEVKDLIQSGDITILKQPVPVQIGKRDAAPVCALWMNAYSVATMKERFPIFELSDNNFKPVQPRQEISPNDLLAMAGYTCKIWKREVKLGIPMTINGQSLAAGVRLGDVLTAASGVSVEEQPYLKRPPRKSEQLQLEQQDSDQPYLTTANGHKPSRGSSQEYAKALKQEVQTQDGDEELPPDRYQRLMSELEAELSPAGCWQPQDWSLVSRMAPDGHRRTAYICGGRTFKRKIEAVTYALKHLVNRHSGNSDTHHHSHKAQKLANMQSPPPHHSSPQAVSPTNKVVDAKQLTGSKRKAEEMAVVKQGSGVLAHTGMAADNSEDTKSTTHLYKLQKFANARALNNDNGEQPVHGKTPTSGTEPPTFGLNMPSLPALRVSDDYQLKFGCEIEVMSALSDLLKLLGKSTAIRHLWNRYRQHYTANGESAMREFGLHYTELRAAVEAEDTGYIMEVLQSQFQLPV